MDPVQTLVEARRQAVLPIDLYCPNVPFPKQRQFRELRHLREALYGGAAGGGKSDELLAEALEYVHIPGYAALLLRRTFPQLTQAEGLIPRAQEWLHNTNARWSEKNQSWFFPTGGAPARLQFGHMQYEKDKLNYQGGAYQFIGFDELTQFTQKQYTYLLSRCRRPDGAHKLLGRVPLRVRSGSNPGGPGHGWVRRRFVGDERRGKPPELPDAYVKALLTDNMAMDQEAYRESLSRMDEEDRLQLEFGRWDINLKGLIYPFRPVNIIQSMPWLKGMIYCLGIDLGTSEKVPTTAFVVCAYHPQMPGVWVVQAEKHASMTPSDIADRAKELGDDYAFETMVVDPGALGGSLHSGYIGEFRMRHGLPAVPAQKANKLGYRKELRGALKKGLVMIVEPQCGDLLDEMETLYWNKAGTDNDAHAINHATDAFLYGWRYCYQYCHRPPESQVGVDRDQREAEQWRHRDINSSRERARKPWYLR